MLAPLCLDLPLWPRFTLLPAAPFVAWSIYALVLRGERRWELVLLLVGMPVLAYTNQATKRLLVGVSVEPNIPTWGVMIADGRNYMILDHWVSTIPGLAIILVVMGLNLFGDGLRDALDPRQKR